ncbi:MAG: hypothetical protein J6A21_02055 [Lentisphaeria bacterium]|nr:hypothetical protein [Lentisphaeria bacterium]
MSVNVEAENDPQEIGIGDVLLVLKKCRKSIVLFFAVSALLTVFLIVAGYFLLPRQELYTNKILIQLQKSEEQIVYPSGKIFSANDIISTPVLRRVYEHNKLEKRISFEDFSKLFFLSGTSLKKGMLVAAYESKFTRKNITLAELTKLEEEYEKALQKLDHNVVGISMASSWKFSSQETARILREVPVAWFEVYSKLESKPLPQIDSVAQIRALRSASAIDGWLITLDRARVACSRLTTSCQSLEQMLMGQKVALPTGETLADLRLRLTDLELRRIRPLLVFDAERSAGKNISWTVAFLQASIQAVDQRITALEGKCEGAVASINILQSGSSPSKNEARASKTEQGAASMTVNLDGSFFDSLTELIRGTQSIALREQYAADLFRSKDKIAELEAEKNNYENMLRGIAQQQKTTGGTLSAEQFDKLVSTMFDELILLCEKTNAFRDLATKEFLSSRQFFATTGEVLKISHFPFPFAYIAACLIFLLIAVNAVYVGIRFFAARSAGEIGK